MLLLIALAHSRMLHAGGDDLTAPAGGGPLDIAVQWLLTSLVDARSASLFGILFGYGLVQLTRRRSGPDGDPTRARRLIHRRGAWLVVFGIAHVVLLDSGDIIGSYGLFAVALAGAVSWSGRRSWAAGAATLAISAAACSVLQVMAGAADGSAGVGLNRLESALLRTMALPMLPIAALTVAPAVLIGIWAGRIRLLEQPDRYRPLLRRAVWIGFPVSVLGAQPVALQAATVAAAGVAVATWVAGVVIADALQRAGRRGPAEALLRYLTYRGRPRQPELAAQ
ncbi:hypothetical protein [Brachybacterium sp.]|uniref:DUF418 domain-containing protein n=1 Tax=Brachybacterium sp. TaxID=1891286 RepID=UPI002ED1A470